MLQCNVVNVEKSTKLICRIIYDAYAVYHVYTLLSTEAQVQFNIMLVRYLESGRVESLLVLIKLLCVCVCIYMHYQKLKFKQTV